MDTSGRSPRDMSHLPLQESLLVREVSETDPRYAQVSERPIGDATLGELAQALDSVLNPINNKKLITQLYADFLDCDAKDIIHTQKDYAIYRSPLIRYSLTKMDGYRFEKLRDKDSSDEELSGGDKDLQVIQIGPNKTVKIPTTFNYGVVDRGGRKFCLGTVSGWEGFSIHFFYDAKGEKAVDQFIKDLEKTVEENNYFKGARITPDGEFLKLSNKTWEDVELRDYVKEQIKNHIVNLIEKEEIYEKNGISSKRGLLFAGRPGTGKTLVCKILASELKAFTFIWVTANDLRSESDVERIYNMARELAPTIVLLEDADLFCTSRTSGMHQPVLGEILSQLDGLVELKKVVTIMTSNEPGALDKALLDRPGRFDVQIVFEEPDEEGRYNLLRKGLSKVNCPKEVIKEAAETSDGYTGAQLSEVVNLAIIYAIDEDSLDKDNKAIVKREHLFKALKNYEHGTAKVHSEDPRPIRFPHQTRDVGESIPSGPALRNSYLEHQNPEKEEIREATQTSSRISDAINRIIR